MTPRRPPVLDLRLDPTRLMRPLLTTVVALSVLSFAGQVLQHGLGVDVPGLHTWVRYTDVDREGNLPSWFQASILLVNAMTLWSIAGDAAASADRWARHWRVLAIAMLYLSVDELTEIHEQAIVPLQKLLGLGGFLYFAWIALAVPLLAVFGLFFLRFLRALPPATRHGILVAFALYVGGAVVAEMIGGQLYSTLGEDTMAYSLTAAVEELLEMLGMVALVVVLARHRADRSLDQPSDRVVPVG